MSGNDLNQLSDKVLYGQTDFGSLSTNIRGQLLDYWKTAGVNFSDPNVAKAQLGTLQGYGNQQAQQQGTQSGVQQIFNTVFKPVSMLGSLDHKLYSNLVAQPLSFALTGIHSLIYGYDGSTSSDSEIKSMYDDAASVSPGQALWELGMNNNELKARGISPDQMAQQAKAVAAGTYRDPQGQTVKDPWGNMTQSQMYFNSGWQQNISGGADLAASWYLDPLQVAGKAGEIAKAAKITKPVTGIAAEAAKAGTTIDQVPKVQQVSDAIMDVKAKSTPQTAEYNLRNQISTLKYSNAGDALATLMAQAKDQNEVNQILRISMGDNAALGNATAGYNNLSVNIAAAKQNISNIDDYVQKQNALGFSGQATQTPAMAQAVADRARYTAQISKWAGEQAIMDKMKEAYGSVENLNFNKTTGAVGNYLRSDARWYNGSYGQYTGPLKAIISPVVNTGLFAASVVRSYSEIKPSNWIDVHSDDSWRELDASLKEAKTLTPEQRQAYVSSYMAANANQRGAMLLGIEKGAVKSMVDKYNLGKAPDDQISSTMANMFYDDYVQRRSNYKGSILNSRRTYGSSQVTDPTTGLSVDTDTYTNPNVFDFTDTGEALIAHPIFETQLENTHQMMDFAAMNKAIMAHGSKYATWRVNAGLIKDQAGYVTDNMNHYWKALQLIRPAYTGRALADDFLGQVARFNSMSMLQRAISGGKVAAEDFFLSKYKKDDVELAKQNFGLNQQHLEDLAGDERDAIAKVSQYTPGTLEHDLATQQLDTIRQNIKDTQDDQEINSSQMAGGPGTRQVTIGRQVFAAPYGGKGGEMARDDIAGTRYFETMMSNATNYNLRRMRQMGWSTITPKLNGEATHMSAWTRVLKDQVAKSYPGQLALRGYDADRIGNMLRYTPEGQQYVKDIGLVHLNEKEMATRVVSEVDHLLNPAIPGMDEIRTSLLNDTFDPKKLADLVPQAARPGVNGQLWDYAVGKSWVSQKIDDGISAAYKMLGDTPSRVLLRNPLFKQEYVASLTRQMKVQESLGVTDISLDQQRLMENAARKQALNQVKSNAYNMTHETKMAYHLRNFGAFFGAQAESYNRWARIVADKPQVLGKVANAYYAPNRAGIITDGQGNKIDDDGYMVDPTTGKKVFVPIGQRSMVLQIPSYLGGNLFNKFMGAAPGSSQVIPMSTLQVVMQEGDGPLPVGAGPIVMMPLNKIAQSNPQIADWAQTAGLLPYGPQSTWAPLLSSYSKKLMDASDPTSTANQRVLAYLMQIESHKYDAGLRKTAPTWDEIQQKADQFGIARFIWGNGGTQAALAKSVMGFLSPVTVSTQDPYQFFRDDYNNMLKLDPTTADQKFLEKYGDSFFDFTESMSKNNSGLKATTSAVKVSQQLQDVINKVGGQYAGLVVGDEANSGSYSNGAYYYEQNTPTQTGSSTMMRSGLSAQEAYKQTQVNRGWAEYDQVLTQLNHDLIQRGLTSFSDKGATDLDQIRKNAIALLTQPFKADGTRNGRYNQYFADAYNTMDTNKFNQNANDLTKLVDDPTMWAKAYNSKTNTVGVRSDLYTLRSYLSAREAMQQALTVRAGQGGSSDINAKSNSDLRLSFEQFTNQLIQSDTKFQSIHTRYFGNDMGYNTSTSPEIAALLQQEAQGQTTTMAGQQAPSIGEVGSLGG